MNAPLSLFPPSKVSSLFAALLACLALFLPSVASAQLYTENHQFSGPSGLGLFGNTVAADGDTIVVGTTLPASHGGATSPAYVYVRGATGWTLQQQLAVAHYDVAVNGNTLVAGGIPYVRSGGTWTAQQIPITLENPRAALQGDTLVLGNPYDRTQEWGGVYVFTRSGSTWTQQAALGPDSSAGPHDMMGDSVALDGDTLLAGGNSGTGGAYVFVRNGTTWTRQTRLVLPTGTGWGMKVALEGDTAAVSDPANGKVYIFTRSGTTWTLTQTLSLSPNEGFDFGYKLSLDGDILVAGAANIFYLYARTPSGWVLAQTISRPGGYRFEGGVAVANRGKLFVTGNPTGSGSVETFSVPPPEPPESGWRDIDIGAVGQAGGHANDGWGMVVRGSGADIWDRGDQFHFYGKTLMGDGVIIAWVTSAGGGNFWAKAGIMFREDVSPAARNVFVLATSGGPVGLQSRGATADTTNFTNAGWLGDDDIGLMLVRSGDEFAGYWKKEGQDWTPIGSVTIKMPPTLHVGLAVTSHDNATLNTASFTDVEASARPAPGALVGWNMGYTLPPGTFSMDGGVLTIDAQGEDIWNQSDHGYYVTRGLITGDFDIRAHITSIANTHPWAKAGLMVREPGDTQERNVFTLLAAGGVSGMQVRSMYGAATTFMYGPWVTAPYWVRLVRTGNSFQSLVSPDGTSWQLVGTTTLDLAASLTTGIAVSSHTGPNITTRVTVESLDLGD